MKKILSIVLVIILAIAVYFWWEGRNEAAMAEIAPVAVVSAEPITMGMLAQHATAADCWMVINGKVIDVSNFVSKHPGGEAILQGCGKDATPYFSKVPEHLKGTAQALVDKLAIGTLAQ